MYAQIFLVSSVRGRGLAPTIAASASLGWTGFMKAALGLRAGFLAMGILDVRLFVVPERGLGCHSAVYFRGNQELYALLQPVCRRPDPAQRRSFSLSATPFPQSRSREERPQAQMAPDPFYLSRLGTD